MEEFRARRVLSFPPETVFDVIADVERYPQFVPGWDRVRVLERRAGELEVEQRIELGPFSLGFRSRARLTPPERIDIDALDGPFRQLGVRWQLAPGAEGGTQVSLHTWFEPGPHPLAGSARRLFKRNAGTLLDRFEQRLRTLYGDG